MYHIKKEAKSQKLFIIIVNKIKSAVMKQDCALFPRRGLCIAPACVQPAPRDKVVSSMEANDHMKSENAPPVRTKSRVTPLSFAFPALILGLLVIGFLLRGTLAPLFLKKESLRAWVNSFGAAGWLVFIALQIFQVVVFVIPGEVMQISGGFIYGFWQGLLFTTLGIAIGSAINYWLGRALGPSFLKALLKPPQYEKLQNFTQDARTFAGFVVLFIIPGIPKDVLCYFAGAGYRSFVVFISASMLARMPGIIGSILAGSAAYREKYGTVIVVAVIAVISMVVLFVFRSNLEALLKKLLDRERS